MEDLEPSSSPYSKPRNVVPKLEKMYINVPYAFSHSPSDHFQFFDENSVRRHHSFKEWCQGHFKRYIAPYADYSMVIELSSLFRLHTHGTITFTSQEGIMGFFLAGGKHLTETGTICIKPIDDMQEWHDYMEKQFTYWDSINFDRNITKEDEQVPEFVANRQLLKDQLEFGVEPIKKPTTLKRKGTFNYTPR